MRQEKHSMDTVFALILFAVFAVCSMLLVLLGGQNIQPDSSRNEPSGYSRDTVLSDRKTSQLRGRDEVIIESTGTGQDRILLPEQGMDGDYVTWIYVEKGILKEALMPSGREPIENGGNEIARVQSFEVQELAGGLLEMRVTDEAGQCGSRYYELEDRL